MRSALILKLFVDFEKLICWSSEALHTAREILHDVINWLVLERDEK